MKKVMLLVAWRTIRSGTEWAKNVTLENKTVDIRVVSDRFW